MRTGSGALSPSQSAVERGPLWAAELETLAAYYTVSVLAPSHNVQRERQHVLNDAVPRGIGDFSESPWADGGKREPILWL